MDPITHAASGAVAMLSLPNRPATRWAVPLAAIASASPDIDVALCHTPLEFLLLHRGITHSLAAAPLLGLLLTLLARVDNLTDKDYQLARTYATPGRTLFVGLKWAPQ